MDHPLDAIMLVDDSEADNFLHERAIRKAGCARSVLVYEDPREAMTAICSGAAQPDMIFLDINMPGMTGWEFELALEALHPLPKEPVLVIMLTTSLDPADRQRAAERGHIDGFLNKPLTPQMCTDIAKLYFPEPSALAGQPSGQATGPDASLIVRSP
jgi:CheY-like chemotaxis protein